MPFLVEISCPTNGVHLASFPIWGQYHYRDDSGAEFPLQVDYAWCRRCERFVECELLPSIDELQSNVAALASANQIWREIDADKRKYWRETFGRDLPANLTQASLHSMWSSALHWRQTRKTPPRCLECGSFFAISVLPESQDVRHPGGTCLVRVGGGTHASVADFPDQVFFNSEGIRVGQESYDDYLHRITGWRGITTG